MQAEVLEGDHADTKALQGTENLTKRHRIAAACFNLSLLMRNLLGVGTPKQWMKATYPFLLEDLIACLFRPTWRFCTLCVEAE